MVGISLGWNCTAAINGIARGLRIPKSAGYKTCPFDICATNYDGVVQCISEDFQFFTDPYYLEVMSAPFQIGNNSIALGEKLIYNNRYKFFFNHESPEHGDLYLKEEWPGGKDHFIQNNFEMFRKRYDARIQNFRNYILQGEKVIFILHRYQTNTVELDKVLKEKYPNLDYDIHHMIPAPEEKDVTRKNYELMKVSEDRISYELMW